MAQRIDPSENFLGTLGSVLGFDPVTIPQSDSAKRMAKAAQSASQSVGKKTTIGTPDYTSGSRNDYGGYGAPSETNWSANVVNTDEEQGAEDKSKKRSINREDNPAVFWDPVRDGFKMLDDLPEGTNRGNDYLRYSMTDTTPSKQSQTTQDAIKPVPYAIPRSQQEAWYNYAATHDVADEYKGDLGYVNLLKSQDSDTIAEWALNDPQMMMRLLNSGVDISDTENLSKNIYDYMWGDNAISLYDYMTSETGPSLGNDAGMISELGRYLAGDPYKYGFTPEFVEKYGTDVDDIIAFMLGKQISNYGLDGMNLGQLNENIGDYLNGGEFKIVSKDSDEAKAYQPSKPKKYANILDEEQYDPMENFFDRYLADSILAYSALNDPSNTLALTGTRTQKAKQNKAEKAAMETSPEYLTLPY